MFRGSQKCSWRFREVPEGLWNYPKVYGTLLYVEIEPRPSRKVHKVVGRWEKGFLGEQGRHVGACGMSTQGRHAGTRGMSCLNSRFRGISYLNPCGTPPRGPNRLWGGSSAKLRPQASTYI